LSVKTFALKMGTKFSRKRQGQSRNDDQFKGIKNPHKMKDVLCLRWMMGSKHKSALLKSLQRYDAEHIASIIIGFLPSLEHTDAMMLPVKAFEKSEDAQTVYHAFFHANIFSLYNYGKAPSSEWLRSLPKFSDRADAPPLIRVVVQGSGGVGKSALTVKHIINDWLEEYDPTIEDSYRRTLVVNPNEKDIDTFTIDPAFPKTDAQGYEKCPQAHKIEGTNGNGEAFQTVGFDILDTAGKEEFSSMQDHWIREGVLFLLCFAVNNKRTWDEIEYYRERVLRVKDNIDEAYAIILVGTKCDLRTIEDEQMMRQEQTKHRDTRNDFVDPQMVIENAKEWNLPYIETSAKLGRNVHFLFRAAVYEYWWQSQQEKL